NAEILRFFKRMIALRRAHPSLRRATFLTGQPTRRGLPDVRWHGVELDNPDWGNAGSRTIAFTLAGLDPDEADLHVMLNMDEHPHDFGVPSLDGRRWLLLV